MHALILLGLTETLKLDYITEEATYYLPSYTSTNNIQSLHIV